jgi:hypothetical protein
MGRVGGREVYGVNLRARSTGLGYSVARSSLKLWPGLPIGTLIRWHKRYAADAGIVRKFRCSCGLAMQVLDGKGQVAHRSMADGVDQTVQFDSLQWRGDA